MSFLLRANGLYMSTSTFWETHGYFGGANDVASIAVLDTVSFLETLKRLNLLGPGIKTQPLPPPLHHLKWGSSRSIKHPASLPYSFSDLHSIIVYKEFFTCLGLQSWMYGWVCLSSLRVTKERLSADKAHTSIWAIGLYLHLVKSQTGTATRARGNHSIKPQYSRTAISVTK